MRFGRYLSDPARRRRFSPRSVSRLIRPLRDHFIRMIPGTGGHFASSLGVLELTMALHYVFETPKDKIVWDTGHQAYFHKMLTGRAGEFSGLRQSGGLSGFLKRSESSFDSFGAGHAGTGISAALGMAEALQKKGSPHRVVAVTGDGALTSGMAFEALNHAGYVRAANLIVVLNDNGMSISENTGALHERPHGIAAIADAFGFEYHGVYDGHDFMLLADLFSSLRTKNGPHLVHLRTRKGSGCPEAEKDPVTWHALTPPAAGERLVRDDEPRRVTFTQVFADALSERAMKDKRVVAITAAMAGGTGLTAFARRFPEAFYDVGICEQHAVTFAAGLACEGFRPVCAIYSTFLQRAVDQIIHDVCIQNLPVIFALDRAGVVGPDGETHQGVFDLSLLRGIPNLTIMAPKDGAELKDMLHTAFTLGGPSVIRYPRGSTAAPAERGAELLHVGLPEQLAGGGDALILALGAGCQIAMEARAKLHSEYGLEAAVINARFVKPLRPEFIKPLFSSYTAVAIVEDHSVQGGFGSAVLELLQDSPGMVMPGVKLFGVQDRFVPHGTQEQQRDLNGYNAAALVEYIRQARLQRHFKAAI